jgi:hypothetical protein
MQVDDDDTIKKSPNLMHHDSIAVLLIQNHVEHCEITMNGTKIVCFLFSSRKLEIRALDPLPSAVLAKK